MNKRTRSHNAKRHANVVAVKSPTPAPEPVSPREQLRLALGELRTSTAYLLETALSEVQHGGASLFAELTSRARTWFTRLQQPARGGRTRASVRSDHSSNPALS